jgi:hypothetical protein
MPRYSTRKSVKDFVPVVLDPLLIVLDAIT